MKNLYLLIASLLLSTSLYSQSIELDAYLGEENAKMVELQMGIYEDAEKTEYLRRIGERLVAQLDEPLFDYQFHLVAEMSPNAFALPGGYLYVTTGLLPILESEDELACILGHEIIHSNNRHAVQQMKKSIVPKLLELPGMLLGVIDEDLGKIFNAPIEVSNQLLLASYSRDYETEADNEGIQLAADAGYNPTAMITALSRLSKSVEVATGHQEEKSYFNDHPYTPERNENIREQTQSMKWTKKAGESDDFLLEFDSVLFGDSPNKGIIRGQQFLHPDLNFTLEYPEEWNIDNQPSNVGAYHSSKKAAAYVSLDNPKLTPEKAAKAFLEKMDEDQKALITKSGTFEINGHKGYMISLDENSSSVPMYAHVAWIPMDGKLFKLMGIGPKERQADLLSIAKSLRILNKEEKNSFTINMMRVVKAKEGETISTLSKRVNNKLVERITAVINNKSKSQKLKEGEEIKVVISYPYQPKLN